MKFVVCVDLRPSSSKMARGPCDSGVQPRVRLQSRHIGQIDGVGRRTHETLRESHGMTRQSTCCDITDPSQRNRETDPLRVYMRSEVENSLQ